MERRERSHGAEQTKIPERLSHSVNSLTVRITAGGEYLNPEQTVAPDQIRTALEAVINGKPVDTAPVAQYSKKDRGDYWGDRDFSEAYTIWKESMSSWISASNELQHSEQELYVARRSVLAGFGIDVASFPSLSHDARSALMDSLYKQMNTNTGETNIEAIRVAFHQAATNGRHLSLDLLEQRLTAMDDFLNSCGETAKEAVRAAVLGEGLGHANQAEQQQFIETASAVVNTIAPEQRHLLSQVYQEYQTLVENREQSHRRTLQRPKVGPRNIRTKIPSVTRKHPSKLPTHNQPHTEPRQEPQHKTKLRPTIPDSHGQSDAPPVAARVPLAKPERETPQKDAFPIQSKEKQSSTTTDRQTVAHDEPVQVYTPRQEEPVSQPSPTHQEKADTTSEDKKAPFAIPSGEKKTQPQNDVSPQHDSENQERKDLDIQPQQTGKSEEEAQEIEPQPEYATETEKTPPREDSLPSRNEEPSQALRHTPPPDAIIYTSEPIIPPMPSQVETNNNDEEKEVSMHAASATEKSPKHDENQDAEFHDDTKRIYGVFDGVSGSRAGDIAAQEASKFTQQALSELPDELSETFTPKDAEAQIADILQKAHQAVYQKGIDTGHIGTSTTASIVKVFKDGTAVIANLGDSRVYVLKKKSNKLEYGTISEENAAYQKRLDNAREKSDLTREELLNFYARNEVGIVLGTSEPGSNKPFTQVYPSVSTTKLEDGDILVLTTDGIHDNLTFDEMEAYLLQYRGEEQTAANELVNQSHEVSKRYRTVVDWWGLEEKDEENSYFRAKPDDMSAVVAIVRK